MEQHATIQEAIQREKTMKAWKRIWKTQRISIANSGWDDLYERINA